MNQEQCPECYYSTDRRRGNKILPCHSKSCSLIDLESAKYYCQRSAENENRWYKNCVAARKYATLWEGKFRVVVHENNKLRKKLKP